MNFKLVGAKFLRIANKRIFVEVEVGDVATLAQIFNGVNGRTVLIHKKGLLLKVRRIASSLPLNPTRGTYQNTALA